MIRYFLKSSRIIALVLVILFLSISALAAGPERQLAGIQLGRPAIAVLKRYGNPTRIIPGSTARPTGGQETQITPAPAASRLPAMPGTLGDLGIPDPFAAGAMPGVPLGGLPTGPLTPGYGPTPPPGGAQQQTVTEQTVTWRYEFPSGISLDVTVNAGGTVTQVTVAGRSAWPLSRTSRGIRLTNTYKEVLYKYGYPENHESLGAFLRISYLNRSRAVFTFQGKTLVGITIALPSE